MSSGMKVFHVWPPVVPVLLVQGFCDSGAQACGSVVGEGHHPPSLRLLFPTTTNAPLCPQDHRF